MDDDIIEIIPLLLSIIAMGSLLVLLFMNIFIKIRKCFPISVNCWFCNKWTWVPYDNRNSFDCPGCLQYNGFSEDGGYNKVIEAQHAYSRTPISESHDSSNGLCSFCNQNQQLKVIQLANFTPLVEENYDEEIEHFRKQLEKAYELCPPCRRVLKSTLLKEKAMFLVNHAINIKRKGINIYGKLLKRTATSKSILNMSQLLKFIQGVLAILVLLRITSDVLNGSRPKWIPSVLVPYLDLLKNMLNIHFSFFPSPKYIGCEQIVLFSFGGIFLEILLFTMVKTLMTVRMNQFLCWSFLALVAGNKECIMNSFQILCCFIILYNSFIGFKTTLPKRVSMKKLTPSRENSLNFCEDECSLYNQQHTMFDQMRIEDFTVSNARKRSPDVRSEGCGAELSELKYKFHMKPSILTSSYYATCKQGSSPVESVNSDRNPWLSGGFWESQNGTNASMKNSISIGSKTCDFSNSFQNRSLPGSIETSLSEDFESLSIAGESNFPSSSTSPRGSQISFNRSWIHS